MGASASSGGGGLDLPAELQKLLREIETRGDAMSHYQLLGVPADADGAAMRRAFLERSKRLHPDAWFRKELGEFGPMMSRAFQRMSAAYQTLADTESRTDYDNAHSSNFDDADRMAVERHNLTRAEEDRRERERRERLLRSKGFLRVGAARKLYEEAIVLAEAGERSQAIGALKTARELDPGRKEIGAKLVELEREQTKIRAGSALALGKEREHAGALQAALSAYGSAFQHDPKLHEAAAGAARCAKALDDKAIAVVWASRAIELRPGDFETRMLLAALYGALGQKPKAKAELQLILSKQPDNKEAKNLLKSL